MKNKRIIDAMGNIDDELILGAERVTRKAKKPYLKWGAVAASFVLIAAAIVFVPMMMEDSEPPLIPNGDLIENVTDGEETGNALTQPTETEVTEDVTASDGEETGNALTQPTETEVTEDVTTSDGGTGSGGSKNGIFALDSLNGRYGDKDIFQGETGFMEWPWNDKTTSEKYYLLDFNSKEYIARDHRKVSSDLIEEYLCDSEAFGYEYDYSNDESIKHTKTVAIYKIKNVSEDAVVAVEHDVEYYVYFTRDVEQPATFGEFMELLGFEENIELENYTLYQGKKVGEHYRIESDNYIMQILLQCTSAPTVYEDNSIGMTPREYGTASESSTYSVSLDILGKEYASFTITSEALGIYKKVFYVSELGYVYTNIMEYGYAYNIGTTATAQILEYLKGDDAIECEMEPYMYYLCGIVTEIGDDYILLDDSVMCKNPEDGVVFKIDVSDPGVYRYVKYGYFEEGSVVQIAFWNRIEVGENNTVSGAISIWEGQLVDGDVIIEE